VTRDGFDPDHPEWSDRVAAESIRIAAEQSARADRETRTGFYRRGAPGRQGIIRPAPDTSATFTRGEAEREGR